MLLGNPDIESALRETLGEESSRPVPDGMRQ